MACRPRTRKSTALSKSYFMKESLEAGTASQNAILFNDSKMTCIKKLEERRQVCLKRGHPPHRAAWEKIVMGFKLYQAQMFNLLLECGCPPELLEGEVDSDLNALLMGTEDRRFKPDDLSSNIQGTVLHNVGKTQSAGHFRKTKALTVSTMLVPVSNTEQPLIPMPANEFDMGHVGAREKLKRHLEADHQINKKLKSQPTKMSCKEECSMALVGTQSKNESGPKSSHPKPSERIKDGDHQRDKNRSAQQTKMSCKEECSMALIGTQPKNESEPKSSHPKPSEGIKDGDYQRDKNRRVPALQNAMSAPLSTKMFGHSSHTRKPSSVLKKTQVCCEAAPKPPERKPEADHCIGGKISAQQTEMSCKEKHSMALIETQSINESEPKSSHPKLSERIKDGDHQRDKNGTDPIVILHRISSKRKPSRALKETQCKSDSVLKSPPQMVRAFKRHPSKKSQVNTASKKSLVKKVPETTADPEVSLALNESGEPCRRSNRAKNKPRHFWLVEQY